MQPLLYTDEYYKEHAKILVNFNENFDTFCKTITTQIDDYVKKTIESKIKEIMIKNVTDIRVASFPLQDYTNFRFFDKYSQKTNNLPHYVYRLNEQNLYINVHWINALYKSSCKFCNYDKKEIFKILQNIKSKTKNTKDIQLTFYAPCNLRYKIDKLMQYINDNNPTETTVTIKTVDGNDNNPTGTTVTIKTVDGMDHFTKYNKRFLHCIKNNQYSNIRFIFQVPKEKETETKTFFNKKPWLNWYNMLYYLNQDIQKKPTTFKKLLFEDQYGNIDAVWKVWIKGSLLIFIWAMLSALQEDQFTINEGAFYSLSFLACLDVIGSIKNKNSFLKHTVDAIPWHIIQTLLRDTVLLYSIYQYRKINYVITAYTLFELWMVQKSLFYKPLFQNLYKQYKAKNTIIISTY